MSSLRLLVKRPNTLGWTGVLALLVACGGDEVSPPPVGGASGPATPGAGRTQDSTVTVEPIALSREVFTYRAAPRDPFRSLLEGGLELRPFLEDLRLTSIIYDARYPGRSVAVLRDVTAGARYQVRTDDELGRLRVAEIRKHEVVLTIEEFGVPRRVVITLRRRQEGGDS